MDAYRFSCFHLSSKQLMCKNNTRVTSCWNVYKSSCLLVLLFSFGDNINVLDEYTSPAGLCQVLASCFSCLLLSSQRQSNIHMVLVRSVSIFSSLGLFVSVLFLCDTCKYFRAAIAMMSYNIIKLNKFDIGGVHKTLK
jgi:hypothetical protein